jgi:acyl-CoA reductase-like NAD-dependent aldehyde dehydrogenase
MASDARNEPRPLLIGGSWRRSAETFELRSPSRPDQLVGRFSVASEDDVGAASAAAAEAAERWNRAGALKRGSLLRRAADLTEERAEALARTMATETGKPIRDARGEAMRAAAILRYYAGECSQASGEVYPSESAGMFLHTLREPLGVVCAITPWNFPLAIPAWKIAPALAFGNAVVWKPAEIAPLSAICLAEVFERAGLPAGVLSLLTGPSAALGDSLLTDPRIDAITFTGSNPVGRLIRERTGAGTKLQLELGGKNPAVVLADADLGLAAERIANGAMGQAGQRCTATSRVLVEAPVADELSERLLDAVSSLRLGDPLDEATDVGPVASEARHREVAGYLELAREEGLRLGSGGAALDPSDGCYVEPTVYLDVDPSSRLSREEIFGPVVCLTTASDLTEAIELADDTPYGLSASVFTTSLAASFEFTRRIRAGVVHVNNETTGAEPHVPFGGMKASSLHSREQGRAAREFFTETKTVYLTP